MLNKVAVVGAGNVGATAAPRLGEKNLARTVVMIDVVDGVPQGKGLDQWQSGPIEGFDTTVVGSGNYDEAAGAEVFVVTAGIARKPGMSRDDLVKTNAGIVRSVTEQISRVAPKSIIVVVSNPLDVMCYVAMKATRFPRERILGMAAPRSLVFSRPGRRTMPRVPPRCRWSRPLLSTRNGSSPARRGCKASSVSVTSFAEFPASSEEMVSSGSSK